MLAKIYFLERTMREQMSQSVSSKQQMPIIHVKKPIVMNFVLITLRVRVVRIGD